MFGSYDQAIDRFLLSGSYCYNMAATLSVANRHARLELYSKPYRAKIKYFKGLPLCRVYMIMSPIFSLAFTFMKCFGSVPIVHPIMGTDG